MTFSAKPWEVTALRDMDADGGDLFLGDAAAGDGPDAGAFADALGHHAEVAAGADEDLFEQADEVDRAEVWAALAGEVAAQIDDGIADELTGAVVGDVAAAIDFVDLDAALSEVLVRGKDVGAGGVASEREDGRMLEEEQRVADELLLAGGDDPLLDRERLPRRGRGRDGGGATSMSTAELPKTLMRHAFDAGEAIEHALGEGRVGVDGKHHLFDRGFELHRGDALGDDLGRVRADDVDAENLAVLARPRRP